MEYLKVAIAHIVARIGLGDAAVGPLFTAAILVIIAIISALAVKFFRMAVTPALRALVSQTRTEWDDRLLSPGVLHALARLIPPVIWYALLPMAFAENPLLLNVLHKACLIYLTVVVLLFIHALLDTLQNISSEHETLRNRPLKGVYQMVNLIAAAVGIIIIISILIDKDASAILTGLGASAAILMLIFKDTILGLVAGVQLSANDMLRPGDWITMSKYGADGYVTEVTLTTVKIQNFDKTVTTIPPYALVSDSFQNWRAMRESGGRRIKRSLPIDVNTITVMPHDAVARLAAEGLASAEAAAGEQMRVILDGVFNHTGSNSRPPHTHAPRHKPRYDADGAAAAAYGRGPARRDILFHRNHRMARIRGCAERPVRPPDLHPPALRAEALPASRRTRLRRRGEYGYT